MDSRLIELWRGMKWSTGDQRQGSEAFEHIGQLRLDDAEGKVTEPAPKPGRERAGLKPRWRIWPGVDRS